MQSNIKQPTIVVFGRTGAGKSAFGNKLANKENLFKEGDTIHSETIDCKEAFFDWPNDSSLTIKYIDTPGFGDNRLKDHDGKPINSSVILRNILQTLDKLKGGFNIGLFCIPQKTRVDAHDMGELHLISAILGHEALKNHTWVVVTQMSRLNSSEEKNKVKTNFLSQLPALTEEHGVPIPVDKILFSDFDDFNISIRKPLERLFPKVDNYAPEISKRIDLNNPNALKSLMLSPEMKQITDHYAELDRRRAKELEELNATVREFAQSNKVLQAQIKKREEEASQYQARAKEMVEIKEKGASMNWIGKVGNAIGELFGL